MRRLGTLATLLFVAAACTGTTPASGSAPPTTTVAPSSPAASGATDETPSVPSLIASSPPIPSGPPSSDGAPSPASTADWTFIEDVAGDFVGDCERLSPAELAARAVAGVECAIDPESGAGRAGILRAGFFLFRSPDEMTTTYRERLAEHGVPFDSGDCGSGQPGEQRYTIEDIWDPDALDDLEPEERSRVGRVGCYFDADDRANVRWTWEDISVYGGLVASHDDLAETYRQWLDLQRCRGCTPAWGGPVPRP